MSLPWPAWTEEEWRERLGMRAAEAEGHPFHGNQWTGGSPELEPWRRTTPTPTPGPSTIGSVVEHFAMEHLGPLMGIGPYAPKESVSWTGADVPVFTGTPEQAIKALAQVDLPHLSIPVFDTPLYAEDFVRSVAPNIEDSLGAVLFKLNVPDRDFELSDIGLSDLRRLKGIRKEWVAEAWHTEANQPTAPRSLAGGDHVVYGVIMLRRSDPRALAGEAAGHPFHGNQWTGGLGQRAQAAFTAAGLKTGTARDVPPQARHELNMKVNDVGGGATEDHVIGAQAIADAVNELKGGPAIRELQRSIKRDTTIVMAAYEPKGAGMTTVTGQGHKMLLINTNYHPRELTKKEPFAFGGFESKRILKEGGTIEDAVKTEYRLSALHEFGHLYDAATDRAASADLIDRLVPQIPNARDPNGRALVDWVEKNISPYAATNPRDAFAEAFTLLMDDRKLPPELEKWGRDVRER